MTSDQNAMSVRVIVRGHVQGVGFRAWTAATARSYQLSGWVRNRSDGTVEAIFHGDKDDVSAMLEACEDGPLAARVQAIDTETIDSGQIEPGFRQKPTLMTA
tara:strand:+ start:552 stop:857 length:306 start_codon:yes stop_codon:yes gene_type:complete